MTGKPTNNGQNGLLTYSSFNHQSHKKGSGKNFLWWCSGAHQDLLRQYPSEHSKYAGIGGVILATFVLASLAGGYAIYSVFGNWIWTVVFAVVWGLIIFNFDRFLVSTMRKYGVSRAQQVRMAVPRLLLALLIGITIARPLELKIFEKEIDVKVLENRHKKMQLNDSLLNIEVANSINVAETERARMIARKQSLEDTLGTLRQAYVSEADGTGGSRQRGIESLTRLKLDAYNNAVRQHTPELQQLQAGIATQDSILSTVRATHEGKRKQYEADIAGKVGFLERNKALSDLADEESSVWWSNLLLSLLIILIEIGPVLSKLILNVGPYDIALAKEELLQMAAAEQELRTGKETLLEKYKLISQKKKQVSEDLVEKITELQQQNIQKDLDQWQSGEKGTVKKESLDDVLARSKEQYDYKDESIL
ncbi:MAG TPA: DUF4407 domain-containing protein [Chitinophagaceae bacterium]|nr:DUF4407 domain-containing protein [Chitinophagaceae bacterium]